MAKVAFVFAGQGAQAPGMGFSFYQNSEASRDIFKKAENIRPGTETQCFDASEAELRETRNTQPCLYTVELAIAAALESAGICADMTAGFSLGEISALAYSGAISFEDGLGLVMSRGKFMHDAAEKHHTSMVAVLKLSNTEVEKICLSFSGIYPVNYNCPGQVSVSGATDEMRGFCAAVKAAGGRTVPLKVSGAFHSPFMAEAAKSFAGVLDKTVFSDPRIRLYSNYTGDFYGDNLKEILIPQIDHPVRWEQIVRNMMAAGVDTFLEIGPGKTLCGFIKRIDSSARAFSVAEYEDIQAVLTEVK